jgi:hypothetical protein
MRKLLSAQPLTQEMDSPDGFKTCGNRIDLVGLLIHISIFTHAHFPYSLRA